MLTEKAHRISIISLEIIKCGVSLKKVFNYSSLSWWFNCEHICFNLFCTETNEEMWDNKMQWWGKTCTNLIKNLSSLLTKSLCIALSPPTFTGKCMLTHMEHMKANMHTPDRHSDEALTVCSIYMSDTRTKNKGGRV